MLIIPHSKAASVTGGSILYPHWSMLMLIQTLKTLKGACFKVDAQQKSIEMLSLKLSQPIIQFFLDKPVTANANIPSNGRLTIYNSGISFQVQFSIPFNSNI